MQGVKAANDHIPTVSIFPWWTGSSGRFHVAGINGAMPEQ